MSVTFKIKRGNKTQNDAYTGSKGELTMVTDNAIESVRLHDGSTQGGFELARNDLFNVNLPLGGVVFEFLYDNAANIGDQDPGNGYLEFDNNNISLANKLYIDVLDRYGTDLTNFLDSINISTLGVYGHFRLFKKSDSSNFKLFTITAVTKYPSGSGTATHYRYTVSQLASSVDNNGDDHTWSDNEEILLAYSQAGVAGTSGSSGTDGTSGSSGTDGTSGSSGTDGTAGSDGYSTSLTNQFVGIRVKYDNTIDNTSYAGTVIHAYKGGVKLTPTTDAPTTGEFRVTAVGNNIDVGNIDHSDTTNKKVVVDNASNIDADKATIDYTIELEAATDVVRTQTFRKISDGTHGTDGEDGYSTELSPQSITLRVPTANVATGQVSDFSGTGTEIIAFKGTTRLEPITAAGNPTTGQFKVTVVKTDGIDQPAGSVFPESGGDNTNWKLTFGNLTAINNNASSGTITYTINLEGTTNVVRTQKVKKVYDGTHGTDGSDGNPGTHGTDGSDGYSTNLTNQNVSIRILEDGSVASNAYSNSGAEITAFKGGSQLTPTNNTPAAGQFKVTVESGDAVGINSGNIDNSNSNNDKIVTVATASNMSADTAKVKYTINLENETDMVRAQNFQKVFDGTHGTDGTSGEDGYSVSISNNPVSLPADSGGSVPSSSYSGTGTAIYAYKGGVKLTPVASTVTPTAGEFRVTSPLTSNITAGNQTLNTSTKAVIFADTSNIQAPTASITFTVQLEGTSTEIERVQNFAKVPSGTTGTAGDDGYSVTITNSPKTIKVDRDGTVDYTDSGSILRAYKGGVRLTPVTSTPAVGEFKSTVSPSNVVQGSVSLTDTGNDKRIEYGNVSALSQDIGKLTYSVDLEGTTSNMVRTQTFTKVSDGTHGTDGTDGYGTNISQQSVTLPVNPSGTVTLTGSGTEITATKGGTELAPSDAGGAATAGYFKIKSTVTSTNYTGGGITVSGNKFVVADLTAAGANTGSITYTIDLEGETDVVRKQNFKKVFDGSAGNDGYSTSLTNQNVSIKVDPDGTTIPETSYTNTGSVIKAFKGDTALSAVSGTPSEGEFTVTSTQSNITKGNIDYSGTTATAAVASGINSQNASITYTIKLESDSTTMTRTQTFQKVFDGTHGEDGYSTSLTNQNASIKVDPDGDIPVTSYANTGSVIRAFKGGTALNAVSSNPTTGQFTVTSAQSNINKGNIVHSGTTATAAVASGINSQNASITYTINLENETSMTRSQTFQKVFDGTDGTSGSSGTDGTNGAHGTHGTDGTDGSDGDPGTHGTDGTDGYTYNLKKHSNVVEVDSSDGSIDYSSTDNIASVKKGSTSLTPVSGSPTAGQYRVTASGSSITAGSRGTSGSTFTFSDATSMTANDALITYTYEAEGIQTTSITQHITKVQSGTDGTNGSDGYRVVVTKNNIPMKVSSENYDDGTVDSTSYSASGFRIYAYRGSTQLEPRTAFGSPSSSQFKIVFLDDTGITKGSQNTDSNDNAMVIGAASSMTTDNADVRYTVQFHDTSQTLKIHYNKVYDGTHGTDGTDGTSGSSGSSGSSGTSDVRLKTQIKEFRDDIRKLFSLGVKTWKWDLEHPYINKSLNHVWDSDYVRNQKIGIIAQELEDLYPELVERNTEGFKEINVLGLASLLIQGLKSLDLDIDYLYKHLKLNRGEI